MSYSCMIANRIITIYRVFEEDVLAIIPLDDISMVSSVKGAVYVHFKSSELPFIFNDVDAKEASRIARWFHYALQGDSGTFFAEDSEEKMKDDQWKCIDANNIDTWPEAEKIRAEQESAWFFGSPFLFQFKSGEMFVGQIYGDAKGAIEREDDSMKVQPMSGDFTYEITDVVAWMPLPKPWKE